MSTECFTPIHICRLRVTRLDAVGNPAAGPNNGYVTDKILQIGATPVIEAGDDKTQKNGCGCIVAAYKGQDLLKRWDLEVDSSALEPGLLEMLIGAAAVTDLGNVIGNSWPEQQFDCSSPIPLVAVEAWADAYVDDHPHPTLPYVHWLWPAMLFQIDQNTLGSEFTQPKVKGSGRGNPNWGTGIWGDQAQALGNLGGYFLTDSLPEASCAYLSQPLT